MFVKNPFTKMYKVELNLPAILSITISSIAGIIYLFTSLYQELKHFFTK